MAATKRNAGLTSAVHRATLNDEELVRFLYILYVSKTKISISNIGNNISIS